MAALLKKLRDKKISTDLHRFAITLLITLAIIPTVYAVGTRTVFESKAAPPSGFNLTFSSPNCSSVKFDWTTSTGASYYIPFLWDGVTQQWLPQGPDQPSTTRSYTWTGLPEKHYYGGQVQAFNADGTGYTSIQYTTTQSCSPPGAPTLTSFTATSCTSVRFNWTEGAWAEFYTPYLTPGGQGPDLPKDARNYTWTGLSQNYTYSGFVWGRNSAGFTSSNSLSTTTPYCSPPSVPQNVHFTRVDSDTADVTWNAPSSGTATSYDVKETRLNGGSPVDTRTFTSVSCCSRQISISTADSYHYSVRACNSAGCSAWQDGNLENNTTYPYWLYLSPPAIVDLRANGVGGTVTVDYNAPTTLSWTTTYANNCTASGEWSGGKTTSGSEFVGNLTSNRTYTLSCTNDANGSGSDTVVVNVRPFVDIKANGSDGPIDLTINSTVDLSWTSYNATSCTASGSWSGGKTTNSSETTPPLTNPGTYTYTLECTGPTGSALDSVTVNISNVPGDLNGDGRVDGSDLSYLITWWGTADPIGDIDHNGVVNGFDLSILLTNWTG